MPALAACERRRSSSCMKGSGGPAPDEGYCHRRVCSSLGIGAPAFAEPVSVKFTEGVVHAFPVLRSVEGEKLGQDEVIAQGEVIQIPRGDRVENRLTFRFRDGSIYDERVGFSQRDAFKLMSYQLLQKGASFWNPSTREGRPGDWPLRGPLQG